MKRHFDGLSLVFSPTPPHDANMQIIATLIVVGALSMGTTWAADGTGPGGRSVVVGTGDPNVDIPAVQAAVNQGGQVLLRGHFSFDQPPTKSIGPRSSAPEIFTVLVSKEVVLSGAPDQQGEMPAIAGGTWPFVVEAAGVPVTIQGLRFVHPKAGAIRVVSVSGMVIANCRIEGIEPLAGPDSRGMAVGINISAVSGLPTPAEAGQPENVSGTISIVDNSIDVLGGTAHDMTMGLQIFSVGKAPDREVNLYISGNRIRNVTERAVNIRQAGGRVHIERNVISTGSIVGPAGGAAPDAIHIFGTGWYLIAHNSIQSDWSKGAGIRVHAGFADWPITGAIVLDNDVNMSAPKNAAFGSNSAGIEIRGNANGSMVLNNRIRGRARAALAVVTQDEGIPANNQFVSNDLDGFEPSLASVFVDSRVTNTLIFGKKWKVQDGGIGTAIVNSEKAH